jgi:hypothetical protein
VAALITKIRCIDVWFSTKVQRDFLDEAVGIEAEFFVWPALHVRKFAIREALDNGEAGTSMLRLPTVVIGIKWLRIDPRMSITVMPWPPPGDTC